MRDAMCLQHREGYIFRPKQEFEFIFASRELFERTLRRRVMECKRIRQVVGTAVGVEPALNDLCTLDAVRVRLADGSEASFSASLVVGKLDLNFRL